MLRNYFNTAWRNLWRTKTFSLIKIAGLGIGLMVCILILLYTRDELSYDQFHKRKAQIFRVTQDWQMENAPAQSIGATNSVIGETFAKEIPEVEQCVRINGRPVTVRKDGDVFTETPLFVDPDFFSVFSFALLAGNPQTALLGIHSAVISKGLAIKYFGTTQVIGRALEVKYGDEFERFIVTAIAENAPQNSTLKTDLLLPFAYFEQNNSNRGWFGGSLNTFLLLSPGANVQAVENKMQAIFDQNTREKIASLKKAQGKSFQIRLALQPMTSIHLSTSSGPDLGMADGSSPVYSYILSCIGIFILIVGCINFINLSIAQSLKRSKEIGVRKVVGGTRGQLIAQFLAESFLVSLVAFAVAILLAQILLPFFNFLANKQLSLSYIGSGQLYLYYFLLLLVTSFVAGFYPSLVLSSFRPVAVLTNKQKLTGRNYLTKGLIVLQFALTIFLIIGTIAVGSQLHFISHADLGYDNKNLVRIQIPISSSSDRIPALFEQDLLHQPGIISVSGKNGGRSISGVKANGKDIDMENNKIDEPFFSTFRIPLLAGRDFSPAMPSDRSRSAIVNESLVKQAGWTNQEALGKIITTDESKPLTIVGVIRDYHFTSLKEKIMPELFTMDPRFNFGEVWIRIDPSDLPGTLSLLQATFRKLVPYFPYAYQFMDDLNAKNYETEHKWEQIISIASLLFIFISCMGLFGLVILSIEQRRKEIGIRKVLGAAISRILVLVSRDFLELIALAFLVAAPVGYYFIHLWLEDFAYKTSISWWFFAGPGLLVFSVALATILFRAMRAARANPVKSLRTE